MPKIPRTIFFDEDAAALLLQLAGGPRKAGTYLSALLRREAQNQTVESRIRALEAELGQLKAVVQQGERPPEDSRHER